MQEAGHQILQQALGEADFLDLVFAVGDRAIAAAGGEDIGLQRARRLAGDDLNRDWWQGDCAVAARGLAGHVPGRRQDDDAGFQVYVLPLAAGDLGRSGIG